MANRTGARLGKVTRVTVEGAIYVELADVAQGFEFGPCLDTVGGLVKGDRVVVQALARDEDEYVITGRLGGTPGVTEAELEAALVPYAEDVDLTAMADAIADALDGKSNLGHTHAAADTTTGTFAIARIPVAASGASSTTAVVRADDSRLNNARTPTAHTHSADDVTDGVLALARLPVAPSGNANATQIVRADDARLSNARTPTAHSHTMSDLPAAAAALAAYPVGAVFISAVATSPATLFGGTWTQISDRMLIAIGANTRWDSALETGGAETVTLTAAQSGLPAHSHGITQTPHSHSNQDANAGNLLSAAGASYGVQYSDNFTGAQNANITINNNTAQNASAAHDNMPPFIAVYMWRRTA